MMFIPWILALWTCITLWLMTEKKRIGLLSGLVSQLLWLVFDYQVGAWGLMPLALVLGTIYVRGWRKWGAQSVAGLTSEAEHRRLRDAVVADQA